MLSIETLFFQNCHKSDMPRPQVDLSPLFTPPSKERGPRLEPFLIPAWKDPRSYAAAKPRSPLKVSISQIANVGFVLAACLGAVVSALYFIKGGEFLQEVAAWPRELFYGRPVAILRAAGAGTSAAPTNNLDGSGDPFSSVTKLLGAEPYPTGLTRPNGASSTVPFATAPSPLRGLNTPAPNGDTFSRLLNQ